MPHFISVKTPVIISARYSVTLAIRPTGNLTWSTLINDWTAHSTTTDTGSYSLTAGQTYDIQVQYYNNQPNAVVKLHWSSPSTPEEAIEPAFQMGINGTTAVDYDASEMFADVFKMARFSYQPPPLDSLGSLTGDGTFLMYAGQVADVSGRYTLTFTGSATVSIGQAASNIVQSYSANTTTVSYTVTDPTAGTLSLGFTNTRRLPSDITSTGVTNLHLMRPATRGNMTTSYPAGTLFNLAFKQLISNFTVVRFMDYLATNTTANSVVQWTDRLLPSYSSQQGLTGNYQGQGGAIEYAIELCNETGKDLWVNIPIQANDDFINKLALGIKYGFDASGIPYSSAQPHPVYPPLQPNLSVYLEYSNETWNWAFGQTTIAWQKAQNEVNTSTTNGRILNYDNVNNSTIYFHRWVILRSKQISDLFRNVWGDTAMMSTIRPLFFYQYSNLCNTACDAFQFLDNYFNNGDGIHVATPHPINYFFYAGGGGWYNSVNDSSGLGGAVCLNPGFETPALPTSTSQVAPAGTSWTLNGSCGIVSNNLNRTARATSTTLGALTTTGSTIGVGYSFTIGGSDVYVNQIGRYMASGNSQTHDLYLFDATHKQLGSTTISTSGSTPGQYIYGDIGSVRLLANQSYSIVSIENTTDSFYDKGTSQTIMPGIVSSNAIQVGIPNEWDQNTWGWTTGSSGHVAGPVDFRYSTAPGVGPVGYPPNAAEGRQAAYIQNSGTFSQVITMPAGVSDVTFYAAQGVSGTENFTVYLDGTALACNWNVPFTPTTNNYIFYRTGNGLNIGAGSHTLTFAGSGNGTVFIDAIKIESVDAMFQNGIQNLGTTVRSEVNWDLAYGLKTAGYEGGFEIGGDAPTSATFAANVDPRVQQDTLATFNTYLSSGGNIPLVFNTTGGAYAVAMSAPYGVNDVYAQNTPKMAAYRSAATALPPPVTQCHANASNTDSFE